MHAIYLTHPQVGIDPAKPVPEWSLSGKGRARIEAVRDAPWVAGIGRIVSSAETKAIETAEILAPVAGVAVETVDAMGENDRAATGFLPPPQFEAAADRFFAEPEQSFRGWERAVDAQARIIAAVGGVLDTHDPSVPLLFVGHGAVGTLLKCRLGGRAIARGEDQPPGGGNLFAFDLVGRRLLCDWTSVEEWQGPL